MGNFLKYALQKTQNDCININGLEPVGRGAVDHCCPICQQKTPFSKMEKGGLELDVGLEPTTSWLRIRRSTNWANPAFARGSGLDKKWMSGTLFDNGNWLIWQGEKGFSQTSGSLRVRCSTIEPHQQGAFLNKKSIIFLLARQSQKSLAPGGKVG